MMFVDFHVPISWRELAERTVRETLDDYGLGLAAQLAYYFFLSLFPTLLFLLALASFLPSDDLVGRVVTALQGVAPQQVIDIIRGQLSKIAESHEGGLLTFGVLFALWSSSAALVAIIDALNRAYDVREGRSWIRQRLTALLLTVGLAAFMLASFALVVAGPELGLWIGRYVGASGAFVTAWTILQWPLVFVLVQTGIGLVYYFAPDVEQDFVWLTPGSLLAAFLWIVGSFGFRLYVTNFGSYNESYGTIGGVMVLLLWLYLSGLVLIVGAELNSEIEHASQPEQPTNTPVSGRKKVIGPRARRESEQRLRGAATADDPGAHATPAPHPSRLLGVAVLVGMMAYGFLRREPD